MKNAYLTIDDAPSADFVAKVDLLRQLVERYAERGIAFRTIEATHEKGETR